MKRAYDFLIGNIPLALRNSKVITAFLRSVSSPLQRIRKVINDYFDEQNYFLRITPQVYLLERLLNRKIYETDAKIRITNSIDTPAIYFSREQDSNMCFFDNGEFFAHIDPFGMDIDFLVFVPEYYNPEHYHGGENAINKIEFYLNKYKLFSTTHRIIHYETD